MTKLLLISSTVLSLSAASAVAQDRRPVQALSSAPAASWNDAGLSYARPVQQLSRGAFATYAPVYRTPGPNTYTYAHGTTVWYGTSVIPVSPAPQAAATQLSPHANAAVPTPVVIHIHQGRSHRH